MDDRKVLCPTLVTFFPTCFTRTAPMDKLGCPNLTANKLFTAAVSLATLSTSTARSPFRVPCVSKVVNAGLAGQPSVLFLDVQVSHLLPLLHNTQDLIFPVSSSTALPASSGSATDAPWQEQRSCRTSRSWKRDGPSLLQSVLLCVSGSLRHANFG